MYCNWGGVHRISGSVVSDEPDDVMLEEFTDHQPSKMPRPLEGAFWNPKEEKKKKKGKLKNVHD